MQESIATVANEMRRLFEDKKAIGAEFDPAKFAEATIRLWIEKGTLTGGEMIRQIEALESGVDQANQLLMVRKQCTAPPGTAASALVFYAKAAQRRIAELELSVTDDPVCDGTEFAHPAWWRGHEYTAKAVARRMQFVLDGKDSGRGALGCAELEQIRQGIIKLQANTMSASAAQ